MKSFFFHFNKPMTLRRKRNVMSVHFDDACHFVYDVDCHVRTKTSHRKRQPRCVMVGRANKISIRNNVATIIW